MFDHFSALLAVTAATFVTISTAASNTLEARQLGCVSPSSPYCCSVGENVRYFPIGQTVLYSLST